MSTVGNRWAVPGLCVFVGLAYLGIGIARADYGFGVFGLLVMLAYGAAVLSFSRRSEVAALLAGSGSDERRAQIQLRASAATAHVLVLAVVAGAMWALAAGSRYVGVFCGLAALAGVTFVAATVWFSRRG